MNASWFVGRRFGRVFLAVVLFASMLSCRGDGRGLDETGAPIKPKAAAVVVAAPGATPTFSTLLTDIFSNICKKCHTGGGAPLGLDWDLGTSTKDQIWANVVNKASTEQPGVLRVTIGKPDDSYVVQKVEGKATIGGGRMPLGGPFLTDKQITDIRAWITAGAKND